MYQRMLLTIILQDDSWNILLWDSLTSWFRFGSSSRSKTRSLCLGHAASTLPTMQEVLNIRHEIQAVSLDISWAFDTVWHPALLSQLSAYGTQGQLRSWIPDFLHSRRQCEPFHLSLFRLEYAKAMFSAAYYSYSSSMISLTLQKIIFISLLMTSHSSVTSLSHLLRKW